MEICAEKIKHLRSSKAWTQQHLAEACGLSLRTIQRVENQGVASKETALSLSAVFETNIESIVPTRDKKSVKGTTDISLNVALVIFLLGAITGISITLILITF
ncbi:transcriptional regulator [Veronia nyctiphanis]|uniref:Transcriptional regulator n=1 Tax=Veronia nyctiphanis TaxID=1278244 RepID=A0A4Q0YSR3_9GAMM|nr:helix-turn-helix transcriptional regulator [Veronia nyctiphanis]RXJ74262.1 transcriptional regulator [Veronia nyctiphanis]